MKDRKMEQPSEKRIWRKFGKKEEMMDFEENMDVSDKGERQI